MSSGAAPKRKRAVFGADASAMELAVHLRQRILETLPTARVPRTWEQMQRWAEEFDRMLRLDGRTVGGVKAVIDFAQRDSFWKANILSAEAVRKHYDRLELQRVEREEREGHAHGRHGSVRAYAQHARRDGRRDAGGGRRSYPSPTPEYYAEHEARARTGTDGPIPW